MNIWNNIAEFLGVKLEEEFFFNGSKYKINNRGLWLYSGKTWYNTGNLNLILQNPGSVERR